MKTFQLPRERMTPEKTRFEVDLETLLTPHDMRWPDGPPANWMLGAPIGNGDFGAVVHGYPEHLSFALAKTNVWQRYAYEGDTLPGPDFATFRESLLKRDEGAFKEFIRVLMIEIDRGERQWNLACHPDQVPFEQMPWELFRPTSD